MKRIGKLSRRALALIVTISGLFTSLVPPVHGNTWFVATNAAPGGDGSSWSLAYTNIQQAFAAAGHNDTIYLGGHTFALTSQLNWPAVSNVTLLGSYAATNSSGPGEYSFLKWPTIITRRSGNIRLLYMLNSTNVTIERVRFRGGYVLEGAGLYANIAQGQIRHVVFENNSTLIGSYYGRGGGVYLNGGGLTFEHSVFANNEAYTLNAGWTAYGGAVYVASGTHRFRNALFSGNTMRWSASSATLRGSAIYVAGGAVTVVNATIVNSSFAAALYQAGGTLAVENSILWNNDRQDYGGTITFSNSCATGLIAGVNGNVNGDPRFETPLFYLTPNSPLLGKGNRTATAAGVAGLTSLTNGATYATPGTDMVNLGYHHPEGILWDLDLYVAPGGSGDGSSTGSPLGSITAALGRTEPRKRIHLAAGNYTNGVETFPLTIDTRTVQLIGTSRTATVINSAGTSQSPIVLKNTLGDNQVEGVTITCGGSAGGTARGMHVVNSVFRLSNSIITNCYQVEGSGLYAVSSHGLITDSIFTKNSSPAPSAPYYNNRGGGVLMDRGALHFDRVIFSGNRVNAQSGSGWAALGAAAAVNGGVHRFRNVLTIRSTLSGYSKLGSAFYMEDGRLTLENVTVATNTTAAALHRASGVFRVENSILWHHPAGDSAGTISFAYSCATGLTAGVQGNITNNPQFADADTNDFQLLKTSLCVNTGTNQTWMIGTLDLAGYPRINTLDVDMGAYEFQMPPVGTIMTIL